MTQSKLLVSDVDFTLLGDADSLAEFREWFDMQDSRIRLVLTSGRFVDSVVESIQQTQIPEPEIVIGGVGTQCRAYPSGAPLPGWDRSRSERWDGNRVRDVLRRFDRLQPQPNEFQSEYKASYFLHDALSDELNSIRRALRNESLDVEIIYSSCRDLDILPAGCNKGKAAEFVANHLGFPPQDVIVCGDSANDLAMFDRGFAGIVVGNGSAELMVLKGPRVYKSSRMFAAGLLDGLNYWLKHDAANSVLGTGGAN